MVDGSGLENRQSESSRGFESHPLRHHPKLLRTIRAYFCHKAAKPWRFERSSAAVREARSDERSSLCRAKAQLWIIPPPPPYHTCTANLSRCFSHADTERMAIAAAILPPRVAHSSRVLVVTSRDHELLRSAVCQPTIRGHFKDSAVIDRRYNCRSAGR